MACFLAGCATCATRSLVSSSGTGLFVSPIGSSRIPRRRSSPIVKTAAHLLKSLAILWVSRGIPGLA